MSRSWLFHSLREGVFILGEYLRARQLGRGCLVPRGNPNCVGEVRRGSKIELKVPRRAVLWHPCKDSEVAIAGVELLMCRFHAERQFRWELCADLLEFGRT